MKYIGLLLILLAGPIWSQTDDKEQLKAIYNASLAQGKAYNWLNYLSNQIGGRLTGSVQAEQAVEYTKQKLDSLGLDRVWLQPVVVPKWVRGVPEFAYIESKPGITNNVPICALGGSVATPSAGIKANVIEVNGIEELEKLGRNKIEGKIVFYNKPMDPRHINTHEAYSASVNQRSSGACLLYTSDAADDAMNV